MPKNHLHIEKNSKRYLTELASTFNYNSKVFDNTYIKEDCIKISTMLITFDRFGDTPYVMHLTSEPLVDVTVKRTQSNLDIYFEPIDEKIKEARRVISAYFDLAKRVGAKS